MKNEYLLIVYTKFLDATDTRGSRIKATGMGNSVTHAYDHALSGQDNHFAAAKKLLEKAKIPAECIGHGDTVNDSGCALVFRREC